MSVCRKRASVNLSPTGTSTPRRNTWQDPWLSSDWVSACLLAEDPVFLSITRETSSVGSKKEIGICWLVLHSNRINQSVLKEWRMQHQKVNQLLSLPNLAIVSLLNWSLKPWAHISKKREIRKFKTKSLKPLLQGVYHQYRKSLQSWEQRGLDRESQSDKGKSTKKNHSAYLRGDNETGGAWTRVSVLFCNTSAVNWSVECYLGIRIKGNDKSMSWQPSQYLGWIC